MNKLFNDFLNMTYDKCSNKLRMIRDIINRLGGLELMRIESLIDRLLSKLNQLETIINELNRNLGKAEAPPSTSPSLDPPCIILHVHNPEGKELLSVINTHYGSPGSYVEVNIQKLWSSQPGNSDISNFVAWNESTHNQKHEIPGGETGTYRIRVRFNNIELQQNFTIFRGQTQTITFVFPRIDGNLSFSLIDEDILSGSFLIDATHNPYNFFTHISQNDPDKFSTQKRLWIEPFDSPAEHDGYITGTYELKTKQKFTTSEFNFYVSVLLNGQSNILPYLKYFDSSIGYGVGWPRIDINPIESQNLNYWFTQSFAEKDGIGCRLVYADNDLIPLFHSQGWHNEIILADKTYTQMDCYIETVFVGIPSPPGQQLTWPFFSYTDENEFSGQLQFLISSTPYDVLNLAI